MKAILELAASLGLILVSAGILALIFHLILSHWERGRERRWLEHRAKVLKDYPEEPRK